MANRDKTTSERNHIRQIKYLRKGVVMLPSIREEREEAKKRFK